MDRALRQGEFAIAAVEERGTFPSSVTPPTEPRPLFVGAYNQLIRRLGKADRLADVFEVLDRITTLGVESDQETLEFVTNASVKDVEFETRAVSMKSLPSGEGYLGRGYKGKGCSCDERGALHCARLVFANLGSSLFVLLSAVDRLSRGLKRNS